MIQYFLMRIPEGELLWEIVKPSVTTNYQALKQRAIEMLQQTRVTSIWLPYNVASTSKPKHPPFGMGNNARNPSKGSTIVLSMMTNLGEIGTKDKTNTTCSTPPTTWIAYPCQWILDGSALNIEEGEGEGAEEGKEKDSEAILQMPIVKRAMPASTVEWLDTTLAIAPTSKTKQLGQLPSTKKRPLLMMCQQTALHGLDWNSPPSPRKKPAT